MSPSHPNRVRSEYEPNRVLIIAEPGGTHDGRLDLMHRLVDVAADCGADVFKSQWTSSATTMCARRHAPSYLDDYRKIEYPLVWHSELTAHARNRGLKYACTAYLPGDPEKLEPYVDILKISSFEAGDASLIRDAYYVAPLVIVSLGMGALANRLEFPRIKYLHCVSSYPAPLDSLQLRYGTGDDGLSDHSRDVRVGGWAVCAGAMILETHFRLDDCNPVNKDYSVAFTPKEFATYVENVRDAELVLGHQGHGVRPCEQPMLSYRVHG